MTDTQRVIWTPDGSTWAWNPASSLWECRCGHCVRYPDDAQRESFADLLSAYEYLSDWSADDAAEMARESHLDLKAVA